MITARLVMAKNWSVPAKPSIFAVSHATIVHDFKTPCLTARTKCRPGRGFSGKKRSISFGTTFKAIRTKSNLDMGLAETSYGELNFGEHFLFHAEFVVSWPHRRRFHRHPSCAPHQKELHVHILRRAIDIRLRAQPDHAIAQPSLQ